ncbi:MAG: hypothetical protein KJ578_04695 [Bacteroidetes bacterium]|nr:hypothetical protein [Bacteroidota bacterium]MBU1580332.1 hypothetical protein [Bacteroidota bacterium]MBU2465675.1 hypothetical protein [Bacteroidota bacterium]MBU2557061.1 hypothetical protein [Bacteroidota bacterium]
MKSKTIRTDNVDVSWQDVDAHGQMSLRAFAVFMQESAWKHAEELGFGFGFMAQHDAFWVLKSIRAQIFQYPAWKQNVLLQTWHRGYQGLLAFRDFKLTNQHDKVLALAASDWVIMHRQSRRPLKTDILEEFAATALEQQALEGFVCSKEQTTKLVYEADRTVNFSETDMHGHMNNTRYFEWAADVLNEVSETKTHVKQFEMQFRNECRVKDVIKISAHQNGKTYTIAGVNSRHGKTVFQLHMCGD